ncbi:uncharacterized protein [Amphiura filiformis]|uniref:uncharacterized protein n=1 Tax=Amphiura filiformis TaxID=82378 RepID=UPI003B20B75B
MIAAMLQPLTCVFCEASFESFDKRSRHIRRHWMKYRRLQRKKPHVRIQIANDSGFSTHVRTQFKEKLYRCEYCQKCFSYNGNLKRHIQTHTHNHADNLKTHIDEVLCPCIQCITKDSTGRLWFCKSCEQCYVSKDNLFAHLIKHHLGNDNMCKFCQKYFVCSSYDMDHSSDYNIYKKTLSQKLYQCEYCQKCFVHEGRFKGHVLTHTNEKAYQCDYCQKCFRWRKCLKRHLQTHTKEKSYQCDICGKCLTQSCHLKAHIRTHSKEKPYQCEYCQKFFAQSKYLRRHIRNCHNTEKTHFQCEYCQKCFREVNSLKRHIRTHTKEKPYQCQVCQKCFGDISHLRRHIRTHTEEKPYQCEYCQKRFGQSCHLKDHIRIHTKEKPYQCEVCQQSFTQNRYLKKHILKKHTEEKNNYQCE